jgi:phospholipase C
MRVAAIAADCGLDKIEHVIVIYAENRSFDHLYGLFPGANGIGNATPEQYTQVDHNGKPLTELPPAWKGKDPDPAFPYRMANKPFRLDAQPLGLSLSQQVRTPVHKYYQNIEQINGGRNNRFAAMSDAGGYTMGYYDGSKLPMWQWAREYTLAIIFFHGGIRRLIPQSSMADLRLHGATTRASRLARAGRRPRWLKHRPNSPASASRRRPDIRRRHHA